MYYMNMCSLYVYIMFIILYLLIICVVLIYIYIFELFTIYSERWILVRFPKQTWGSIFHVGVLASSVRVVLVLVSASSVWISQQRLNLFIIQTYQYKMG